MPTEIDTFKMEIFASFVYLIESLTNCEESHVLVDLLKCDGHIALSSSLTRTARESYIVDRISQYIEVYISSNIVNFVLTIVLTIAL